MVIGVVVEASRIMKPRKQRRRQRTFIGQSLARLVPGQTHRHEGLVGVAHVEGVSRGLLDRRRDLGPVVRRLELLCPAAALRLGVALVRVPIGLVEERHVVLVRRHSRRCRGREGPEGRTSVRVRGLLSSRVLV